MTVNAPGAAAPAGSARAAAPPPSVGPPAGVSGGSEVYRIEPNGNPMKLWSQSQDVVYAIAFDSEGRALIGAGNHGSLYRIESPTSYTALLTMPATQITAFQKGRDGRLFAATGNVGKVYEIGPASSTKAPSKATYSTPRCSRSGAASASKRVCTAGRVADSNAQRQSRSAAGELEPVVRARSRRRRARR